MRESKMHDAIPRVSLAMWQAPEEVKGLPGTLNMDAQIRHLINEMIRVSPLDRYRLAAEMSRLTGETITHHMLNAWTATKEGNRFPVQYLTALEVACDSYLLSEFLAGKRGCTLLVGDSVYEANLGRIDAAMQALEEEKRKIQRQLAVSRKMCALSDA